MLPTTRLPQIGPVTIPAPGPTATRCPDKVRETDGDLFAAAEAVAETTTSGRELFGKACDVLNRAFFPQDGAAKPTGAEALWASRVLFQFVLLFYGVRQNQGMLAHTPNAATHLVPAIDCALRFSDVLKGEDQRVKQAVDFGMVAQQRDALADLRELLKLAQAFCKYVEAGTTQIEQYLDAVARFVYKRLGDSLGEDYLMQGDLEPLVSLIIDPIDAAQETAKKNAQLTSEAEERGASRARAEMEKAPQPAPTPAVVVSAPAPPLGLSPRTPEPPPPPAGRTKRRT